MRPVTRSALLTAALLSGWPLHAEEAPYRLRNGETTGLQVDAAIGAVNAMLDDPALTLWLANPIPGRTNLQGAVPVYIVQVADAAGMVMRVPDGCFCMVIGGNEFEAAFEKVAAEGPLIADHKREMLTFLLLHEMGHIRLGHYGPFLPDPGKAILNLDENDTKAQEDAADAFAAEVLRTQLGALDSGTPVMAAMNVIMFVQSLSFIVSSRASIDNFGARVLGDPAIFWDHSRSHPNFEYRLLKINHAISPTETSQALLDDYEAARQSSGRSITIRQNGETITYSEDSREFRKLEELMRVLPQ
jgi:hypothetical protein